MSKKFSLTNLLRNITLGDVITIGGIIAPLLLSLVNPKPKEEPKMVIVNNYYCFTPIDNTRLQLPRINKVCLS